MTEFRDAPPVGKGNPENGQSSEPMTLDSIIERLKPEPGHEPTYGVREFKGRDTRRLIQMVKKLGKTDAVQEAGLAMQGHGDAKDATGAVLTGLLDQLEDEFLPFLADLAGKTAEEMDDEPGAAYFRLMDDLLNDEGFLGELRYALRFVAAKRKLFGT